MIKKQKQQKHLRWLKPVAMLLLLITGMQLYAQENYTISGKITDIDNGETLFGASVFLEGTSIGVVTNEYGFYSITAPKGEYRLLITYMGYADIKQELNLNSNQKLVKLTTHRYISPLAAFYKTFRAGY